MAPITRTCSAVAGAALLAALAAGPALANTAPESLAAYVRGRAADGDGRNAQAAADFARALQAEPDNGVIAIRAYRAALDTGDTALERRARAVLEKADVAPGDAALLALADALAAGDAPAVRAATARISTGPIDFLAPMVRAWLAFGDDPARALALIEAVPPRSIGARYAQESRALLLLAAGRTREATIALDTLLAGQDDATVLRWAAARLLAGQGRDREAAVLKPARGSAVPGAKADARFGISRLFLALARDLAGDETAALAIVLARAAHRLAPDDGQTRIVLAEALGRDGATTSALAELDGIAAADPAHAEAQIARIDLLRRSGETARAQAIAASLSAAPGAGADDAQRNGELLMAADRPADAARAFALAIDRAGGAAGWALYLQAGSAHDRAGNWRAALPLVRKAVALAPDQAIALNYLGYSLLEHDGDVAEATRLLERAAALKPGNSAILDSLAWAYFRSGDAARALPLLERAAQDEPADATIGEHLGDAYWQLGRRYEARYAWAAAGQVAPRDDAQRIAAKISDGLAVD